MRAKFVKMQGAGNDYIYFDCLGQELPLTEEQIARLSDRHFGIGGDGVVLICKSDAADAKMRMFNADGSEGKMCGNAVRCVGKYLYEHGMAKNPLTVETKSGIKTLFFKTERGGAESVTVDMGAAEFAPAKIPVLLSGNEILDRPAEIGGKTYRISCVSMGNPHCVVFADPDEIDLETIGPLFENSPLFPERVNAEFVKKTGPRSLKMRVWERGSGETMACGTGACAAVAVATKLGMFPRGEEIEVALKGGILRICAGDTVKLTGGAETVFYGEVEL